MAVSKDILFIECFNCPKPFPFDIYYILDIIFIGIIYAILVKTADEETATELPAAFVIAFNPIPGPFAVI